MSSKGKMTLEQKNFIWTMISGLLYSGVSVVLPMIASWIQGQEIGGQVSYGVTAGQQLLTVGVFAVRAFQVSDYRGQWNWNALFSLRVFTAILMGLCGIVWVLLGGYDVQKAQVVLLFMMFQLLSAFSDLFEGDYQKEGRFYVAGQLVALQNFFGLITYTVLLISTKNVVWALLGMDVVFGVVVVLGNGRATRHRLQECIPRFSKQMFSLLVTCLPAFVNAFLLMYLDNCSKYAVEQQKGDAVYLEFSALFFCVFVVNLFASFFLKTMLKRLSDDYHEGNTVGLYRSIRNQMLVIGGLTLVCLLGAEWIGLDILSLLYQCDLLQYRGELVVLMLAGGLNACNSMLLNLLVIMRRQRVCLCLTACCSVAALLTQPWFVRRWGLAGAGVGFLCVVALLFALYGGACWQFLYQGQKEKEI